MSRFGGLLPMMGRTADAGEAMNALKPGDIVWSDSLPGGEITEVVDDDGNQTGIYVYSRREDPDFLTIEAVPDTLNAGITPGLRQVAKAIDQPCPLNDQHVARMYLLTGKDRAAVYACSHCGTWIIATVTPDGPSQPPSPVVPSPDSLEWN